MTTLITHKDGCHVTRRWYVLVLLGLVPSLTACGGGNSSAKTATTGPPSPAASVSTTSPPPGLPSDWSARAISAAKARLAACAQANSLTPQDCPQSIAAPQSSNSAEAVHWTLLNEPLANAAAVPASASGDTGGATTPGQVTVYGLYQMDVSYTTSGQAIRPYLDYSGGVASATMTWDGTSFQNVAFTQYPVTLPAGVTVAPFARPTEVSDAAALAAVKAGFHDCVSLKISVATPFVPDCPEQTQGVDPFTKTVRWVLRGDPLQGALVSFDTQHGDFTVTGSFDLNFIFVVRGHAGYGPNGTHTNPNKGNYTATLAWNGHQLSLLNIASV